MMSGKERVLMRAIRMDPTGSALHAAVRVMVYEQRQFHYGLHYYGLRFALGLMAVIAIIQTITGD